MPALSKAHLVAATVDDLMRLVIQALQTHGERVEAATKGANTEIRGVLLELTNPRARLSRTETRGRPFSCLGELCWYLAKTNDFAFISYYVPRDPKDNEDGKVFGGYGPRLFSLRDNDQVEQVIRLLKDRPHSRRAAIQLFEAGDLALPHGDIPCTCTLQFLLRNEKLEMLSYMRSNDVYLGLPHDIFCFTMLQELVARSVGIDVGTYRHAVGSLHLYDGNQDRAQEFIDEGFQATKPMPAMPVGDPWPSVGQLTRAEQIIRERSGDVIDLSQIEPYWADLVRLLLILSHWKSKEMHLIAKLRNEMDSAVYNTFIDARLRTAV